MDKPAWQPSTIVVLTDPEEGEFILPTKRDITLAEEEIRKLDAKSSEVRSTIKMLEGLNDNPNEEENPDESLEEEPPTPQSDMDPRIADRERLGALKAELRSYEMSTMSFKARVKDMKANAEIGETDAKADKLDFYVRSPDYGEWGSVEEQATDYVAGEAIINRQREMIALLVGRVKLGEEVLSIQKIRKLRPGVATKLHNHIMGLAFPDPNRVPFLRARWTPPVEAS